MGSSDILGAAARYSRKPRKATGVHSLQTSKVAPTPPPLQKQVFLAEWKRTNAVHVESANYRELAGFLEAYCNTHYSPKIPRRQPKHKVGKSAATTTTTISTLSMVISDLLSQDSGANETDWNNNGVVR